MRFYFFILLVLGAATPTARATSTPSVPIFSYFQAILPLVQVAAGAAHDAGEAIPRLEVGDTIWAEVAPASIRGHWAFHAFRALLGSVHLQVIPADSSALPFPELLSGNALLNTPRNGTDEVTYVQMNFHFSF